MDHMFAAMNMGGKKVDDEEGRAPIELLSQFLLAVQASKMKEAQAHLKELLIIEPDNELFLDYQTNLKEFIDQGLDDDDEEEEENAEEESEDDDEEEEGDEDNDGDDENEENESPVVCSNEATTTSTALPQSGVKAGSSRIGK
mmetsp:Transcript_10651/g.17366  ORF Transcript_10651/g.17366 Transcript_10651/m.17366 type:complete len:143 (+) Transcript_10651:88-516(+)|eukprot:CAMPEP_0174974188 /NCGR_PEP_ID=MMETSP0004_2-20121128/11686_1 /TAXON_ID=420556 /ORGANISM="Ochromonas sp., Strain CCMP1393" /LENGTH=142 /DNA_ID=CAMNT_0016224775 /DNA_START=90 /DNA_END=518 /DNA_ORIENTATION=-